MDARFSVRRERRPAVRPHSLEPPGRHRHPAPQSGQQSGQPVGWWSTTRLADQGQAKGPRCYVIPRPYVARAAFCRLFKCSDADCEWAVPASVAPASAAPVSPAPEFELQIRAVPTQALGANTCGAHALRNAFRAHGYHGPVPDRELAELFDNPDNDELFRDLNSRAIESLRDAAVGQLEHTSSELADALAASVMVVDGAAAEIAITLPVLRANLALIGPHAPLTFILYTHAHWVALTLRRAGDRIITAELRDSFPSERTHLDARAFLRGVRSLVEL